MKITEIWLQNSKFWILWFLRMTYFHKLQNTKNNIVSMKVVWEWIKILEQNICLISRDRLNKHFLNVIPRALRMNHNLVEFWSRDDNFAQYLVLNHVHGHRIGVELLIIYAYHIVESDSTTFRDGKCTLKKVHNKSISRLQQNHTAFYANSPLRFPFFALEVSSHWSKEWVKSVG